MGKLESIPNDTVKKIAVGVIGNVAGGAITSSIVMDGYEFNNRRHRSLIAKWSRTKLNRKRSQAVDSMIPSLSSTGAEVIQATGDAFYRIAEEHGYTEGSSSQEVYYPNEGDYLAAKGYPVVYMSGSNANFVVQPGRVMKYTQFPATVPESQNGYVLRANGFPEYGSISNGVMQKFIRMGGKDYLTTKVNINTANRESKAFATTVTPIANASTNSTGIFGGIKTNFNLLNIIKNSGTSALNIRLGNNNFKFVAGGGLRVKKVNLSAESSAADITYSYERTLDDLNNDKISFSIGMGLISGGLNYGLGSKKQGGFMKSYLGEVHAGGKISTAGIEGSLSGQIGVGYATGAAVELDSAGGKASGYFTTNYNDIPVALGAEAEVKVNQNEKK